MLKKGFYIVVPVLAVAALLGSGFLLGYEIGQNNPKTLTVHGATNIDTPDAVKNADFSTFWQAWETINQTYLHNKDITNQARVDGAISGLVASLNDPYTAYFNPEDNKKFQSEVGGDFEGIGAEIGARKENIVVIAPLKDSPAMRAGLKTDDWILKIDATSTDGMSVDEAVTLIRGKKATTVTLLIMRNGWDKPKEFKITREKIVLPTLDFEMRGDIAYVQLHAFNDHTQGLFGDAARKIAAQHAKGIVLDLRNDPGGYLNVAVGIAGYFIPEGKVVVSEVYRDNTKDDLRAGGNAILQDIPVVVLINKGSASASEILAGTLRDNRGTKLIGEQSFGKGTVQELKPLREGASLKVTIAKWVLPSGIVFENGGLKPDVEVKITDKDIENKKDPQLDKALEIMRELIKK